MSSSRIRRKNIMTSTTIESLLTCTSWQQAQDVIDHLFSKQLISKAEMLPTEAGETVQLILENIEDNLSNIHKELAEFFGHDNFTLTAIPR